LRTRRATGLRHGWCDGEGDGERADEGRARAEGGCAYVRHPGMERVGVRVCDSSLWVGASFFMEHKNGLDERGTVLGGGNGQGTLRREDEGVRARGLRYVF
jgi:hypothetical protein